jgi:uncharacterized protein YjbI with pentapeptide repeats
VRDLPAAPLTRTDLTRTDLTLTDLTLTDLTRAGRAGAALDGTASVMYELSAMKIKRLVGCR